MTLEWNEDKLDYDWSHTNFPVSDCWTIIPEEDYDKEDKNIAIPIAKGFFQCVDPKSLSSARYKDGSFPSSVPFV